MNKSHWTEIHRVWHRYTPPVRPNGEVVDALWRQIGGRPGPVLLLGVTPELADIAPDLVALDKNPSMVANLWPGNAPSRRAVVGNWLNCNFAPASFAACIGDGSLCVVRYPDEMIRLCGQLAAALRPGGRLALRVFAQAEIPSTPESVAQDALRGAIRNFHGFKWRLAMAIAGQRGNPNVEMGWVFEAFHRMFPDRGRLAASTGWNREEIETIEFLKGSSAITSFPSRRQLQEVVERSLSDVRFVSAGTYEVAEHCPLLVADRA